MLFFVLGGRMQVKEIIRQALMEDIHTGDITTNYLDLEPVTSIAFMIAKAEGILAGVDVARQTFRELDKDLKITLYKKDGDRVKIKDEIMRIEGKAASILQAERTALNFIQRLSGIATKTNAMANLIQGTDARILDTRKTTPLLRELEKQAVRIGGAFNHRFGLYDMILLKENHIRAAGSITEAVSRVKMHNTSHKIEVEVTNLQELEEAISCGVDRVMLDNMPLDEIKTAAKKYRTKIELEISGGVNETNIQKYARSGVHYISIGALTHSAKALDISLLFKE